MSNVNVNLTPYLKQWVEEKITSGRYNNISEVIREALRLLEARDELRAAKIRDLRAAIDDGESSGEAIPLDIEAIKREGRARRSAAPRATQE